jgi:hypothetical protein
MKNQKTFVLAVFIGLALACLQTAALGQGASQSTDRKAANIKSEGMGVRFDSTIPFTSATLTISAPDGKVYQREFKSGSTLSFALLDKAGAALGNGQYTYEIRFTTAQAPSSKDSLTAAPDAGAEDENGRTNRRASSVQSVVQSGSFVVQNGALYLGNETEPTNRRTAFTKSLEKNPQPTRTPEFVSGNTANRLRNHRLSLFSMPDQVIADDLIVQGSACIGLDCVNNESFGFDTIRLKENNTRIKFDDTSTSAGFPNHDWQLTANDSASGGLNKFSIEDITAATVPFTVEGSAPTNSVFVDSTGRVGLRTGTPALDLHIATSNTPASRLEQNNSGGFVAQTWDIGGNEANFFVRDVTSGSRLPFRIRPGAPTSSIDINGSGNVGIGTASPAKRLHVLGPDGAVPSFPTLGAKDNIVFENNANNNIAIVSGAASSAGLKFFLTGATVNAGSIVYDHSANAMTFFTNGVTERMRITSAGRLGIGTTAPDQSLSVIGDASKSVGGGSWQVFSDERLKNIKGGFNSGLKAVMQLQPIRYQYKADNPLGLQSGGENIGFKAQALQKVIPEAVTTSKSGYLMVNNDPILWTMLNAIKEQQQEIADLKAQVQKLRAGSRRHRK